MENVKWFLCGGEISFARTDLMTCKSWDQKFIVGNFFGDLFFMGRK